MSDESEPKSFILYIYVYVSYRYKNVRLFRIQEKIPDLSIRRTFRILRSKYKLFLITWGRPQNMRIQFRTFRSSKAQLLFTGHCLCMEVKDNQHNTVSSFTRCLYCFFLSFTVYHVYIFFFITFVFSPSICFVDSNVSIGHGDI